MKKLWFTLSRYDVTHSDLNNSHNHKRDSENVIFWKNAKSAVANVWGSELLNK